MKTIHLHIDRIVVDGLDARSRSEFAQTLETQLREWAESGLADQFPRNARKHIGSLDAGQLRAGATGRQAATRIVDSVKASFSKGPKHA